MSPLEHSDLSRLIGFVHHRWNVPVVAELYRHTGARFVTMVNHLGVGRASQNALPVEWAEYMDGLEAKKTP